MKSSQACLMPDAFQRIVEQKQVANVNFLIQQAELRKSELKNNSVQEFVKLLNEINNDRERLNLNNIEVSAYAFAADRVRLEITTSFRETAARRSSGGRLFRGMKLLFQDGRDPPQKRKQIPQCC